MLLQEILNAHRGALSALQMKMIIRMILEPKHKNLKGQNKIKPEVQKIVNIRRHMSILMAFKLYYFQAILNW
jgi:hypothetical protein